MRSLSWRSNLSGMLKTDGSLRRTAYAGEVWGLRFATYYRRLRDVLFLALRYLVNLIYNYLTICKWVVYEFCFWNKKQIRNKNGFLGKSSFFCLHYFSFLSLACNQSTNPSYYYAFSSWFNICFFIYPGIRSEKRKVLFSMIDINMCKVKNNHPSNQIFVYF